MLMVATELRPSSIHGLGVFLLQPVKKGEVIWRFDARVDRVYSAAELEQLPAHVRDFLTTYCTWHEATGLYVLCGDNGRFFNHSDTPNTFSLSPSFGEDIAARDLAVGEELTSDYATICDIARREAHEFQRRASPSLSPVG